MGKGSKEEWNEGMKERTKEERKDGTYFSSGPPLGLDTPQKIRSQVRHDQEIFAETERRFKGDARSDVRPCV
jgi:hypothetical protein